MRRLVFSLGLLAGLFIRQSASAQAFYRSDDRAVRQDVPSVREIQTVYPNPTSNSSTLVLNYIPMNRVHVDVMDYNGNIRQTFGFAPGTKQLSFDVGGLDRGYYFVRVHEQGRLIANVRLVKN